MGDGYCRFARNADCGHGDPMVGETRTAGCDKPSCVLLLLAMFYGIIEGTLFAVAAFICSAFLLYDPIYSFRVSDERALGELFWFLMTAVVGVKCVAEFHHRSDKS
jgi:Domain of unknown function (DUF4118)